MPRKMHLNSIIKSIAGGSSSAHAYIIEGKPGSGRDGFITKLAMGLECLDPDISVRPCGRCSACRQVAADSSMDIVRMQMSGKTGYKTEDANAFSSRLDMGAYGRFLVGIIDDADSLSETVQNKLLKTLEEPRPDVILLLGTSNPDHLLSTVRSRCSSIRIQSDNSEDEASEELTKEIENAALLLSGGGAFCEFRDAMEKAVKTRADALTLIDRTEEIFRERMMSGDMPSDMAARLELCEKARADIERDMDRNKALKRLRLELTGH